MGLLLMTLAWRVWLIVTVILMAGVVSRVVFQPTKKSFKQAAGQLPFILIWPLAIFSPKGRSKLFNLTKKI